MLQITENKQQYQQTSTKWEEGNEYRSLNPKDQQYQERSNVTRWGANKTFIPPCISYIPEFLTLDQTELVLRQYRIEEISRKLTANDYDIHDKDVRSPSPEPIYDPKTNQRINTREARAKEQLIQERTRCIEECLRLDPSYKPPADYKPPVKTRKLYIPQYGETPANSYVQLIIGPNGRTQKALQKKTNCKIYIRGEGATRGKNYRFDTEGEPIHVLIEAHKEDDLEYCASILEPILSRNYNDPQSRQKRLELMRLASQSRMALSYKADWCEVCGEQGHKKYSCPNRPLAIKYGENCDVCNENHAGPCPAKKKRKTIEEQLEEFNRKTGAGVFLSQQDIQMAKSYKQSKTEVVQEEFEEEEAQEEDVLPPGVDNPY